MKRRFLLVILGSLCFASAAEPQSLSQDEKNQRFLQNLAVTCSQTSAAWKAKCGDILAEYSKEGLDPRNVRISRTLKKVLVEIAKKLAGLGSSVGAAVGIVFVGEPTGTEIHDIDYDQIPLSRRRDACIRDMSVMKPDAFNQFLANRKGVADRILRVLDTK